MRVDSPRLSQAELAVTSTAVAGDTGTLYHIVSGLLDEGIPLETVLFDLLIPTAAHIGLRWQQGDYLISEEHAATAALETVVSMLAGSFDQPESGLQVVVATVEGDAHSLPARAAAAYLLFVGYRTTFLGASVPAADLKEYLAEEAPTAALLSSAMTMHLPAARDAVRAGHEAGVPVIVGGRAFGEGGRWAPVVGADAWVGSPRDVVAVLESWDPNPAASEARARDSLEELSTLRQRRPLIVAQAHAEVVRAFPGAGAGRLLSEVGLLVGSLEGAVLVGDPEALVETLLWQRETLVAHGIPAQAALVGAIRSRLDGSLETAGAVLDGAVEAAGI